MACDCMELRAKIDNLEETNAILKRQNEYYKNAITDVFKALIKANKNGLITDTLWVGNFTTVWDVCMEALDWSEDDLKKVEEE